MEQFEWGHSRLTFRFEWSSDSPVRLAAATVNGRPILLRQSLPFVEILTTTAGHTLASDRLVDTAIGASLRYVSHQEARTTIGQLLTINMSSADYGVDASVQLELPISAAAVRSTVALTNLHTTPVVLRSVSSWASGFTIQSDSASVDVFAGWDRVTGISDWLGEGRWGRVALRSSDFPALSEALTGHNPRSEYKAVSTGTWSTGRHLPVAAIENRDASIAWAWQIEHNGAWRWEIGENTHGGYFALSGPTELDSNWSTVLGAGDTFTTVPVTVAVAEEFESAIGGLTDFRRATRRAHPDNSAMPVVFNDYMNTLNGDPTTEKLLPLIQAAAQVGAEVFCIDAGWYDDSGHWWDSVGEWLPSSSRFPNGLQEAIDAIDFAGMVPGLWLEPEVVGVRSPLADRLPKEAFLLRHGQRVVEHDRFHLDLRHPAAIAHLDEVVDRLVSDFGIGFFKFDYNINPGAGTDHDATSLGDGLLRHNRAHLAWLDRLLDRHPTLVIENCSSGAMRMDYALLSRLAMQSTSDQQDFVKYPPIAAAAPISILPEQAASWAYPQPEMTREEVAFSLATGLLGRFYVSGYLNQMDSPRKELVTEAVKTAKEIRGHIATAHPHWPLGLPAWDGPWVALGLESAGSDLVTLWKRGPEQTQEFRFSHYIGFDVHVETVFPLSLPLWTTEWDRGSGTLTVHAGDDPIAARTLRLTPLRT